MTTPTLLVMAAGMGSRYGGLKQIDPVGPSGETIIDYSVYDAIRAGFGEVVFVIRRDIEAPFREAFGRRFEEHIPVRYVFQELDALPPGYAVPEGRRKPWGTGHAVLVAREAISRPFAVISADDFYGADLFRVLGDYLQTARDADGVGDYAMGGFVLRNTLSDHGSVSRGICQIDAKGNLVEVVERTKVEKTSDGARFINEDARECRLTGDEIVSMVTWGFTPSVFDHLEKSFIEFLDERIAEPKSEFFLPTVVNRLLDEGRARMRVLPNQGHWLGVTYPEDKPHVERGVRQMIDTGQYPESLWSA